MKRFLALAFTCLPFLCLGAPSISYTSYFNNTHTYTNATVASALRAGTVVATNGLTGQDLTASQATFTDANKKLVSTGTSAALSAALSDETGSGAAVFATGPTFSGITAGASTFSGAVGIADGTVSDPSLYFTSDNDGTGTGIYRASANTLRIASNGSARFSVSPSSVGIPSDTISFFLGTSGDVSFIRDGAANILQLGSDSATPSAQTFKGPDGSGTDIAGGAMQHEGGRNTGTGRGGPVIIRTSNSSGTSSSTLGTQTERFHAAAKWVTLTSATATTIFTIPISATNYVGLTATVTIYATDGTDHQSKTSVITVDGIAKTTTITPTISQVDNTTAASAGTLTCTYTATDNGSNVMAVKAAADSSLSETVLRAKIVITAINSNGTGAVTEM